MIMSIGAFLISQIRESARSAEHRNSDVPKAKSWTLEVECRVVLMIHIYPR